ncbi:universal stress protein [Haloarchaeobius sp. DFWS5]|uniref:universal stress protein n=1 Tax=Haloarchaeobius sp. DFWS5 TaxID=3446114 RepID=UPI003EBB1E98
MYDDILLPTDGSDGAAVALERALDLAGTYGATLHVLNVADTNRDSVTVVDTGLVDALEEEGEEIVDDVVDQAHEAGVSVVDEVIQGDPYQTILDYVDSRGIDLVVMATHGRRGIQRYLLGSVTEKIVRTSPVPVLTVRMPDDE